MRLKFNLSPLRQYNSIYFSKVCKEFLSKLTVQEVQVYLSLGCKICLNF